MSRDHQTLEAALTGAWPIDQWRDVHVVLAVSGGADSVALLRAVVAVKKQCGGRGRLFVAHYNHMLRPVDAADDEAWLADLCCRLGVPLEVGRGDVSARAAEQGDGVEVAARAARYEFLEGVASRFGARFVAVAHTADDQVETVLHRVIRGTGVAGLAGIPRVRPLSATTTLVRPLLTVRRTEVLLYLESIGQEYRTDASNADLRFTRNRIRNDLLPKLRSEYNADLDAALLRLAAQAEETQQLIGELARELCERGMTVSPSEITIDCIAIAGSPTNLLREACKIAWTAAGWPLQHMGFDHWQRLADFVGTRGLSGTHNFPGGVRATYENDRLRLSFSP